MPDNKKANTPKASAAPPVRVKGVKRANDTSLGWVARDYPQLDAWRTLAVAWLKGETKGIAPRLKALVNFFEGYLVEQRLPLEPAVFLACTTVLPDFFRTACPDSISRSISVIIAGTCPVARGSTVGGWQPRIR